MRFYAATALAISLAGCAPGETEKHIAEAQQMIRDELRDAESAEFKDEKIRTLWSKDGSRQTLYCGMVSGNNAFGGKTGYKPVTAILEAVHKRPGTPDIVKKVWSRGSVNLTDGFGPTHYLNCERADTERKNGEVFLAWPPMGREWSESFRAEVDSKVPVLSMDEAPPKN